MRAQAHLLSACLLLCLTATGAWAAGGTTHTVTTTSDSGAGSLRNAIQAANLTTGSDLIRFDASLSGQTIYPLTQLPALADGGTTIDGDVNADGKPDIALCGTKQTEGDGVTLSTHSDGIGCTVKGLAIYLFPRDGIVINESDGNRVRTCHLGVNLPGGALKANGRHDIYILGGNNNVIGGTTAAERNVIAGGNGTVTNAAGVNIEDGEGNLVQRNYFGIKRSGSAALGTAGEGVRIDGGDGNTVGGSGATTRNIFGGLEIAVGMTFDADTNTVTGNYIGTTVGGAAVLPLEYGVVIGANCNDNTVGGPSAGLRNIFAGGAGATGVFIVNTGAASNTIAGNYFGLTANGLAQLDIDAGVSIMTGPLGQTIGGGSVNAANYFCCLGYGVVLRRAGAGTVVRKNKFGVLKGGTPATGLGLCRAIEVDDVFASISENTVKGVATGVRTLGAATPRVTKNSFAACTWAVGIRESSKPNLGNLGNSSTVDDGGNVFANSAGFDIYNETANSIKAEGNDFGTTSKSAIDARVYDHKDNASCGRVDLDPLIGGVHPTGDAVGALALAGASAVPSASGAEIAFTLSAPADVTVTILNLAGRPVATLAADRRATAGVQRLAWSGLSAQGLRAPAGTYLVRIAARTADGAQAAALTPLVLER